MFWKINILPKMVLGYVDLFWNVSVLGFVIFIFILTSVPGFTKNLKLLYLILSLLG